MGEENRVGTAIVGCGYVGSFYCSAIPQHPILRLAGVTDRNESLDDVLNDGSVELVLNLTNPKSHFAVSQACLEAGKNVYSEKPLAMTFAEAQQLVKLAEEKGLYIASAPSRVLAETAQTVRKALREKAVGTVHGV